MKKVVCHVHKLWAYLYPNKAPVLIFISCKDCSSWLLNLFFRLTHVIFCITIMKKGLKPNCASVWKYLWLENISDHNFSEPFWRAKFFAKVYLIKICPIFDDSALNRLTIKFHQIHHEILHPSFEVSIILLSSVFSGKWHSQKIIPEFFMDFSKFLFLNVMIGIEL